MQYVIIGGSFAAMGAIEGIRKVDQEGGIKVISEEPVSYSRPLISYYLAGKTTEDMLYYRDQRFFSENRVERISAKAGLIRADQKTVALESGEELAWDKLLLAVGGKPSLFHKLAEGRDNVVGFYTLSDAQKIKDSIRAGSRVVVIGAGLVGLKAAEALRYQEVDVTVVDALPYLLAATLDQESARMVQRHLEQKGVKFRFGQGVTELEGAPQVSAVALAGGEKLPCDLVIIAAGTGPNLDLAQSAGIATQQGMVVDDRMQTSVPGIYAAGDAVEALELLSQQKRVLPLLPVALEQGRVAGLNMAGRDTVYRGSLALNSTSLMGMTVMSAGDSRPDGVKAVWNQSQPPAYRKIVTDGNIINGVIAINRADKMGLLTDLIRRRTPVQGREDILLSPVISGVEIATLLAPPGR